MNTRFITNFDKAHSGDVECRFETHTSDDARNMLDADEARKASVMSDFLK